MAITYVGLSSAVSGGATTTTTQSLTPGLPASTAVGHRVFVVEVGSVQADTTPADWNELVKNTQILTGTPAAGSGLRYISVYYRDYDGFWTMPTFTTVSGSNPSHAIGAVAVAHQASTTTTAYGFGSPTVSTKAEFTTLDATAHSADTSSVFTTHAGAMLLAGTVHNGNVTMTGASVTQESATLGSTNQRHDSGTSTGNDVSIKTHTISVTSGAAAPAVLNLSGTLSAASQGGTVFIEQPEISASVTSDRFFAFF